MARASAGALLLPSWRASAFYLAPLAPRFLAPRFLAPRFLAPRWRASWRRWRAAAPGPILQRPCAIARFLVLPGAAGKVSRAGALLANLAAAGAAGALLAPLAARDRYSSPARPRGRWRASWRRWRAAGAAGASERRLRGAAKNR